MKPLEFLERLKRTRLGKEIIGEADRADQRAAQRAADVREFMSIQAERGRRLTEFLAEEARVTRESVDLIFAAHREAMRVQAERQAFDYQTAGQLRRLEQRLRVSCDPLVALNGPALTLLGLGVRHVVQHNLSRGTEPSHVLRERLRDLENDSESDSRAAAEVIRERLTLADAAQPVERALDIAIGKVSELQLTSEGEVVGQLREIAKSLPERCPCGVSLAFLQFLDRAPQEMPPEARTAAQRLDADRSHRVARGLQGPEEAA